MAEDKEERVPASAELAESGGVQDVFPSWAESAWRLYARGQRNWSALGRQFGVDDKQVKRWVMRFGQAVAAARRAEGSDPNAEYEAALEEILGQAWADHVNPVSAAQVGALRIAMEALEKLAAARGVTTDRKATDLTSKGERITGVIPVFSDDDPMNHVDADEPEEEADDDCAEE
jgi:transposase-like protein